jgi:hypothetical protein
MCRKVGQISWRAQVTNITYCPKANIINCISLSIYHIGKQPEQKLWILMQGLSNFVPP